MFYVNFVNLCNSINKSPSAAAEEMGFKKSSVTRWKNGTTPTDASLQRIANYFGVSANSLISTEEKADDSNKIKTTEDDLKFALFNGDVDEITDEMYDDVKRYAQYIKEIKKNGKNSK